MKVVEFCCCIRCLKNTTIKQRRKLMTLSHHFRILNSNSMLNTMITIVKPVIRVINLCRYSRITMINLNLFVVSSLLIVLLSSFSVQATNKYAELSDQINDKLQPRRRQSQATLLSHKQNLITGSANSPFTSPYNQFYLTNNVNSPHNGRYQFAIREEKTN